MGPVPVVTPQVQQIRLPPLAAPVKGGVSHACDSLATNMTAEESFSQASKEYFALFIDTSANDRPSAATNRHRPSPYLLINTQTQKLAVLHGIGVWRSALGQVHELNGKSLGLLGDAFPNYPPPLVILPKDLFATLSKNSCTETAIGASTTDGFLPADPDPSATKEDFGKVFPCPMHLASYFLTTIRHPSTAWQHITASNSTLSATTVTAASPFLGWLKAMATQHSTSTAGAKISAFGQTLATASVDPLVAQWAGEQLHHSIMPPHPGSIQQPQTQQAQPPPGNVTLTQQQMLEMVTLMVAAQQATAATPTPPPAPPGPTAPKTMEGPARYRLLSWCGRDEHDPLPPIWTDFFLESTDEGWQRVMEDAMANANRIDGRVQCTITRTFARTVRKQNFNHPPLGKNAECGYTPLALRYRTDWEDQDFRHHENAWNNATNLSLNDFSKQVAKVATVGASCDHLIEFLLTFYHMGRELFGLTCDLVAQTKVLTDAICDNIHNARRHATAHPEWCAMVIWKITASSFKFFSKSLSQRQLATSNTRLTCDIGVFLPFVTALVPNLYFVPDELIPKEGKAARKKKKQELEKEARGEEGSESQKHKRARFADQRDTQECAGANPNHPKELEILWAATILKNLRATLTQVCAATAYKFSDLVPANMKRECMRYHVAGGCMYRCTHKHSVLDTVTREALTAAWCPVIKAYNSAK